MCYDAGRSFYSGARFRAAGLERVFPLLTKITGILGGVLIAGLAVGTFAIGAKLGPDRATGANLYKPHGNLVQLSSTTSVIPASYETKAKGTQVASAASGSDSSGLDDITADGPGATFEQVYVLLKHNYVDGVPSDTRMAHGAAAAMVNSLSDPASRFLEQSEVREMLSEQKGIYHGIGAVTDIRLLKHVNSEKDSDYTEYRLTIVAPLAGSPAETAGLQAGDVITHINSHWIAGFDPGAANAKKLRALEESDPTAYDALVTSLQKQVDTSLTLQQAEARLDNVTLPPDPKLVDKNPADPPSDNVTLVVERPGVDKPMTFTVPITATTTVPAVSAKSLPGNVGYVHISQFNDSTTKAIDEAVSGFGNDLKGLIVDLRNAPGGDVDTAAEVDGKLSGAKFLGLVESKGKNIKQIAVKSNRVVNCPLAVIVNGGTANTAELLAASLHDQGYKLVGEKTFGDAMEVAPVTLRDGAGFTMTVGQFFTLSHKPFDNIGLTPDVAVAPSGSADEQLNQALAALTGRVAAGPSIRG